MESFGQELRHAREAKGISLEQIADVTLINVGHLEAIERGDMAILPQAYVRAFIREYASIVGLDPADAMRRYEEAMSSDQEKRQPAEQQGQQPEERNETPVTRLLKERSVMGAVLLLLLLVAAIALILMSERDAGPPVAETPFIVQTPADTSAASTARPGPSPSPDSLMLRAVVRDSLWAVIAIDSGKPVEYIFRPGSRHMWRARERFVLTLGNARAAEWTLDGEPIGALQTRKRVVRDLEVTRSPSTSAPE